MDIPAYEGNPLAQIVRVTDQSSPIQAWMWGMMHHNLRGTVDHIDRLVAEGYAQVPRKPGAYLIGELMSQCADGYIVDANQLWVRQEQLEHARKYPVILAFQLEGEEPVPGGDRLAMLQFLPPPRMGEIGIVNDPEVGVQCSYLIQHLPWDAQVLYSKIGKAISELASPAEWMTHNNGHAYSASELGYQQIMVNLRSNLLRSRGQNRQDIKSAIEKLEKAHREVVLLRQSWLKQDWLVRWGEIRAMTQQLASEYWKAHTALKEKDKAAKAEQQQEPKHHTSMPDINSSQKTPMPSNNRTRAIVESFGPAMQPSLWNNETASEQTLATPNGALLRVKGDKDYENKALYQYITTMMGPEGIKHMITLVEAYLTQTGANDRKDDARVSLRQLLIRMGYAETRADDINERRKLIHTILYLARTYVTSSEVVYEEEKKGRGGKRKKQIDVSPMLVIEGIKSSEDGGLDVPDEVVYHFGVDFYNSLFGEEAQFFRLPTALILGYHATREQQELCLSYYLSNMVTISNAFAVSFRELIFKSAIMSIETIDHDGNRTRKAERVILAIEHLERDGLILRAAHECIDLVLAIELLAGNNARETLAPATIERIEKSYQRVKAFSESETRTKKREALQSLLASKDTTPVITFYPGPLLAEQAKLLQEKRQKAIDRSEDAQVARVVKRASRIVNSNLTQVNAESKG
jgi:hypothetical protein